MASHNRICKVCGKEFVATPGFRAYCSDTCRRAEAAKRSAERYARKHKRDREKICKGCGKEFTAANNLQQYCDECRAKKHLKKEKYCKVCGTDLLGKQRSYCSAKCRDKAIVKKVLKNGTICWECKWSTGLEGRCPWARSLKPVPGWEAKKVSLKISTSSYTDSYIVKDCPLFEEG